MNRRKFIKNTVITGAVVAASAITGFSVLENNNTENKRMKILVITGSPRKNI